MKTFEPENQINHAISLEITADLKVTGQQMRDGQAVDQVLTRPSSATLLTGAQLYHRVEGKTYMIVSVDGQTIRIKRETDGAEFDTTAKQLKRIAYIVHTTPSLE